MTTNSNQSNQNANINYNDLQSEIRHLAKDLLESKKVRIVIGYGSGPLNSKPVPVFITDANDVDRLVYNEFCFNNLSIYLTKAEIKAKAPWAIVVKGCDARSVIGLVVENQIKRDDVFTIGVSCNGVKLEGNTLSKCDTCAVKNPSNINVNKVIGNIKTASSTSASTLDKELEQLNKMSAEERFQFWKNEFDRCIRCYGCRQICPHCFCNNCIAEKSAPQWISTTPGSRGNFAWNAIRAFHLVGRCVECMECSRACPMGIRLDLLNHYLAQEVRDSYNFVAGMDLEQKPPLTTYNLKDNQDFIK
ncbi:MAG: 4Fe-4S dicluster domain-containing protein [Oligoflexia bacterium]|nr:4Fe-4S dicluster domain-containing protein [Oligoflexia bacterium]